MHLVVLTNLQRGPEQGGGHRQFRHFGTLDYKTQDGELDILDAEGVVTDTYNSGAWVRVSRNKRDEDEWPESVLRNGEGSDDDDDESEDPTGASDIGDVEMPGWLPGREGKEEPPLSHGGQGERGLD